MFATCPAHLILCFFSSSSISFFPLPPAITFSSSPFLPPPFPFCIDIDCFAYRNHKVMKATPRLLALCERFHDELIARAEKVRAARPKYELPPRKNRMRLAKHKCKCSCSEHYSCEILLSNKECYVKYITKTPTNNFVCIFFSPPLPPYMLVIRAPLIYLP